MALFVAVGALSHQHERAFSAAVFYIVLGAVGAVALSLLDVRPLDPVDHALVEADGVGTIVWTAVVCIIVSIVVDGTAQLR